MCDLFALSAATTYSAPRSLPIFAARASRNMDGWGIGFYKKSHAHVEKSAARAYEQGRLHDGFQRLARVIASKFIIAHVRLRSSGPVDECHSHPFAVRFEGEDWLFAHNGKAPAIESYRGQRIRLEDVVSDSARIFEFLLDGLGAVRKTGGDPYPLFVAIAGASTRLIREYPGTYNFLLTNGSVLFAFSNHRQFLLLKGSENLEKALLLTTVEQGLSGENWVRFAKSAGSAGLLMAIAGSDIVLKEEL